MDAQVLPHTFASLCTDDTPLSYRRAIMPHVSPERFPELVPTILRAIGEGEITAWVMAHGTYFERVAWAALLLEAVAEDDTLLTYEDMVTLFGKRWADQCRRGLHRLRKKILQHFGTYEA